MIRLLFFLLILFSLNSCRTLKENDQYGVQYFIKNIYNDSDIVKAGSLLSEPFKLRDNNFPSIIILGENKTIFTKTDSSGIEQYIPKGLELINYEDFKDDIEKLENEKIVTIDSINFHADKNINYLGYLTIFQVFINSTRTKVCIYYSTMDATKKRYRTFISEIHLLNGRWKEMKLTIQDMN